MENIANQLNEKIPHLSTCLKYDSEIDKKIRIHIQRVEEKLRLSEIESIEKQADIFERDNVSLKNGR